MGTSVFEDHKYRVYKHRWQATIEIDQLVGGTPTDANKAAGWLKAKMGIDKDDIVREMAAEVMVERGITMDEAVDAVVAHEHLNGFKRFTERFAGETSDAAPGGLFVEGRQMKACVKEAANIQWPKERWGPTKKGTRGFFAEHLFIEEDRLPILTADGANILEPTGIHQRFVHTFRGSGIQYEEFVENAIVKFTVLSDYEFSHEQFGTLWVTAEQNGFGASRSQGFGRFAVIGWDSLGSGKGRVVPIVAEDEEEEAATAAALVAV